MSTNIAQRMLQGFISIIFTCGCFSVVSSQTFNDPFREDCIVNASLPTHQSGSTPFYDYIHTQSQIEKHTVKYTFDGRPASTGNSFMDIYLRPAPLLQNGSILKRPLVFILHGGDGSRQEAGISNQARRYAQRGYIAVVPDYRAGKDPVYGDALCRDSMQVTLTLQHSVVDVRGSIRKFISMARENQQLAAIADTSSIFLIGFSWGAATAYSVAVSIDDEWRLEGQIVTGVNYFADADQSVISTLDFYESLDGLDVNGSCTALDKSFIKGVSCSAMPTLNLGMVDESDTIPLMLYHGTCDPLAPFYKTTSRQLLINAVNAQLSTEGIPIPNSEFSPYYPCSEPQYNYTFYGSQAVYEYIRDVLHPVGSIPFLTRIFRVCGGQHGIENEHAEFERTIFFRDILNAELGRSESISLDFTLSLPENANFSGTKEYFNCFYQASSNVWPGRNQFCKSCSTDPYKHNAKSRCPYYDAAQSIDSPDRYMSKPVSYCADLGGQAASTIELNQYQTEAETIELYDISGRLLRKGRIQGYTHEAELQFLRNSGLSSGIYVVRYGGISRKVGLFL